MAECGKGCMPECRYFTTGGCVSPFNCMYKIERESITTATSIPLNPNVTYTTDTDKDNEIARLQAENAALRKQISEMLTPLCTLGDKLYHYELSFGDGFDENGNVIHTSSMDIIETEVTRDNIWRMCDLVQNKRAFFSREALAASFKERFQKGREQFVKEIKDDKRRMD